MCVWCDGDDMLCADIIFDVFKVERTAIYGLEANILIVLRLDVHVYDWLISYSVRC